MSKNHHAKGEIKIRIKIRPFCVLPRSISLLIENIPLLARICNPCYHVKARIANRASEIVIQNEKTNEAKFSI